MSDKNTGHSPVTRREIVKLSDFPQLERSLAHWPPDWRECMLHFLQSRLARSGSVATLYNYVYTLTAFYAEVKHPEGVTRQQCERFIHASSRRRGHIGAPVGASCRNVRQSVITSWYTYASSYTIPTAAGPVPLWDRALPTAGMGYSQPPQVYRQLSEEEIRRFFTSIDQETVIGSRDYSLFLAYVYTSRRRDEIASLTWGCLSPCTFKGGRQGMIYRFRNKGRSQIEDSDEWPPEVHAALLKYLEKSGRLATMDADSPLWIATPNRTGGGLPIDPWRCLGGGSVYDRFVRICEAAGIEKAKRCIHSFRHFSAKSRYEAGEDIVSISKHLRHRSLGVTTQYMQALASAEDQGSRLLAARFHDL